MSNAPEEDPHAGYVPVSRRQRTVDLEAVLRRKPGVGDDIVDPEPRESPGARMA
jgi:hypothetical protein